ncbi:hypothetical protein CEUSTIGMA_g1905.t1 [Chlamydomonas eustigma]|uniref:Uncharacterized protein n=1 Tax=Chlamydomonas eustigma TaxID=1157962 RepID=A0A250WUL8_9CHLO|nr:hypothetical protein CEUSTIGMA_g1905.t1 [Chlamydomonas eustigma]|eukprot:GAX74456.1 hypothetical protein CEUSTIGMA_g1905.t1 [Chlamydomonas eustigma]
MSSRNSSRSAKSPLMLLVTPETYQRSDYVDTTLLTGPAPFLELMPPRSPQAQRAIRQLLEMPDDTSTSSPESWFQIPIHHPSSDHIKDAQTGSSSPPHQRARRKPQLPSRDASMLLKGPSVHTSRSLYGAELPVMEAPKPPLRPISREGPWSQHQTLSPASPSAGFYPPRSKDGSLPSQSRWAEAPQPSASFRPPSSGITGVQILERSLTAPHSSPAFRHHPYGGLQPSSAPPISSTFHAPTELSAVKPGSAVLLSAGSVHSGVSAAARQAGSSPQQAGAMAAAMAWDMEHNSPTSSLDQHALSPRPVKPRLTSAASAQGRASAGGSGGYPQRLPPVSVSLNGHHAGHDAGGGGKGPTEVMYDVGPYPSSEQPYKVHRPCTVPVGGSHTNTVMCVRLDYVAKKAEAHRVKTSKWSQMGRNPTRNSVRLQNKLAVQTVSDWEILLESDRRRLMGKMDDVTVIMKRPPKSSGPPFSMTTASRQASRQQSLRLTKSFLARPSSSTGIWLDGTPQQQRQMGLEGVDGPQSVNSMFDDVNEEIKESQRTGAKSVISLPALVQQQPSSASSYRRGETAAVLAEARRRQLLQGSENERPGSASALDYRDVEQEDQGSSAASTPPQVSPIIFTASESEAAHEGGPEAGEYASFPEAHRHTSVMDTGIEEEAGRTNDAFDEKSIMRAQAQDSPLNMLSTDPSFTYGLSAAGAAWTGERSFSDYGFGGFGAGSGIGEATPRPLNWGMPHGDVGASDLLDSRRAPPSWDELTAAGALNSSAISYEGHEEEEEESSSVVEEGRRHQMMSLSGTSYLPAVVVGVSDSVTIGTGTAVDASSSTPPPGAEASLFMTHDRSTEIGDAGKPLGDYDVMDPEAAKKLLHGARNEASEEGECAGDDMLDEVIAGHDAYGRRGEEVDEYEEEAGFQFRPQGASVMGVRNLLERLGLEEEEEEPAGLGSVDGARYEKDEDHQEVAEGGYEGQEGEVGIYEGYGEADGGAASAGIAVEGRERRLSVQHSVKTSGIGYTVVRSAMVWEPDADQMQEQKRQQQLQELEEQLVGSDGTKKQKAASRAAKALQKVSSWEREEEEASRQGCGQRSSSDGASMVKLLPRSSRDTSVSPQRPNKPTTDTRGRNSSMDRRSSSTGRGGQHSVSPQRPSAQHPPEKKQQLPPRAAPPLQGHNSKLLS